MAWRTNQDDVRQIIKTIATVTVAPFIDTATALTDYVSSKDSEGVLTTALLLEIEKHLAAHFYALRDPQYQQKRTEKASATFQGKTDLGLDLTWWGQMAKTLDVSGCLAQLDKGIGTPQLVWLGLPPSEQTDYEDRD